jgi:hypothetical protein
MKVKIIITQKQQVRSWLSKEVVNDFLKYVELEIFAPDYCEPEILKICHLKVNYYHIEENDKFENFTNLQKIAKNWRNRTFRYIAFEQLKPAVGLWHIRSYSQQGFASIRQLAKILLLIIAPWAKIFLDKYLQSYVVTQQLSLPYSDLTIVVANVTDLRTRIVSYSAAKSSHEWMLVPENWDNISSKLAPDYNPDYLGVWSEQCKRQSISLHGFPGERVKIIGSPRINSFTLERARAVSAKEQKTENQILVFYAGAGVEYETIDYFMRLEDMLNSENSANLKFKITFRPHPLQLKKYGASHYLEWQPLITVDIPQVLDPSVSDWPTLNELLYAEMVKSDIVIGSPSTFLLEAIVFDKKIVLDFQNFRGECPRKLFSKGIHFDEIIACESLQKVKTIYELHEAVVSCLNNPLALDDLKYDLLHLSDGSFAERVLR